MNRKLQGDQNPRFTLEEFRDVAKLPIVVVLDNVRSMGNIGSVFRTADAMRVSGIVLCGITAKPPHRDINKTALGATESVNWRYESSTLEAIASLRAEGYMIVGVEQAEQTVKLNEFAWDVSSPIAIIFGNEVDGVAQAIVDACDSVIEIPQSGTKHSLNVSVAAGVVLWELFRKVVS